MNEKFRRAAHHPVTIPSTVGGVSVIAVLGLLWNLGLFDQIKPSPAEAELHIRLPMRVTAVESELGMPATGGSTRLDRVEKSLEETATLVKNLSNGETTRVQTNQEVISAVRAQTATMQALVKELREDP